MNIEQVLAALEARHTEIAAALDAGRREGVREEIVALFHEVDGGIEQLTAFKERIRPLVDRYKQLAAAARPAGGGGGAVRADHLGSSTYIERGWSAIAAGDHDRANKELERALELAPDDPQAETLIGWAQMLRGEYDDALYTYSKVLARDPNNALARVNLGYICLKKEIYGEAIEHLARAIRLDTDRKATLYAHFYMGLVYLEREMLEDARGFFRRALELGPNLLEAHWEIGRSFYREGRLEEAAEAWRIGVETNRFNVWGERCGEALARMRRGEPVEV